MAIVQQKRVPVTMRAVAQRINRKLNKEGEKLVACRRSSQNWPTLGDWYIVDIQSNFVARSSLDLATLAEELGVLRAYEAIEE